MVDIIIPTFNRKNVILDAVSSVFFQNFPDIRVIIIDDGSNDYTSSLIDLFIKYPFNKFNKLNYPFKESFFYLFKKIDKKSYKLQKISLNKNYSRNEQIISINNNKNTNNLKNIKNIEKIKKTKNIKNIESIKKIKNIKITNNIINIENIKSIENINSINDIKNIENIEYIENIKKIKNTKYTNNKHLNFKYTETINKHESTIIEKYFLFKKFIKNIVIYNSNFKIKDIKIKGYKIKNSKTNKINFKRKLIYIKLKKNYGTGFAKNIGLSFTSAQYIGFLDSDDIFVQNKILKCISFLKKNNAKICQTNDIYFKNNKRINLSNNRKKISGYIFIESLKKNRISISSLIIKSCVLKNISFFNIDPDAYIEKIINIYQKTNINLNIIKNTNNKNYLNNNFPVKINNFNLINSNNYKIKEYFISEFKVLEEYYFYLNLTFKEKVFLIQDHLTVIRQNKNYKNLSLQYTNYEEIRIKSLILFFLNNIDEIKRKNNISNIIMDTLYEKYLIWIKGAVKRKKYYKIYCFLIFLHCLISLNN